MPHLDSDRFYHLAISRWMNEISWIPRSFPAVENLGWGIDFPERYWLYHLITALAWKLGGTDGVFFITFLLGACIPIVAYLGARTSASPKVAFSLTLLLLTLSPAPMIRAASVRPVTLAVLFLVLLLISFKRRSLIGALLSSFLGMLAYHAFYLPLIVIAAHAWIGRKNSLRVEAAALTGLVIGIFSNPYFPHPLIHGVMIAMIGANWFGVPDSLPSGMELHPWGSGFLLRNLGPILLVGAAVFWGEIKNKRLSAPLLVSSAFLLLTIRQARAIDFLAPVAVIAAANSIQKLPRMFWAAMFFGGLIQMANVASYLRDVRSGENGLAAQVLFDRSMTSAVKAIPPEAAGKKVFNCNWTTGAHLAWFQPQVRFVDILDPVHLWFASREIFNARAEVVEGRHSQPIEAIKTIFSAQYVLCDGWPLNRQLHAKGLKPIYSDRFGTELFALP